MPGNVQAIVSQLKIVQTLGNNACAARSGKGAADREGVADRDGDRHHRTAAVLKAKAALRAASAKGDDEWGWLPPVM